MSQMTVRENLVMDLEETIEGQGWLPMYDFAWTLRGYDLDLTAEQIQTLSIDVHAELVAKYGLRLVWTNWPIDIDEAWPAEPGTALDFDLDPDGSVNDPLLVLVPAASRFPARAQQ
jgi:hypothetical protein